MSLLSRIFGKAGDDRAPLRPLWHRIVELARDPAWYAECGIADTVPGRFDAITLVLGAVLLRMEQSPALRDPSVLLSELFIDDMEGQLRQSGVGDLVVGKHVGKLMSTLGGRLGALRDAIGQDDAALVDVIARNVSMIETGSPDKVAVRLRSIQKQLSDISDTNLLAGNIG